MFGSFPSGEVLLFGTPNSRLAPPAAGADRESAPGWSDAWDCGVPRSVGLVLIGGQMVRISVLIHDFNRVRTWRRLAVYLFWPTMRHFTTESGHPEVQRDQPKGARTGLNPDRQSDLIWHPSLSLPNKGVYPWNWSTCFGRARVSPPEKEQVLTLPKDPSTLWEGVWGGFGGIQGSFEEVLGSLGPEDWPLVFGSAAPLLHRRAKTIVARSLSGHQRCSLWSLCRRTEARTNETSHVLWDLLGGGPCWSWFCSGLHVFVGFSVRLCSALSRF